MFDLIADTVRSAIQEGQFRPDVDPDQFAYEFWGAMLAFHHASRLMRDARARQRAQAAFDSLVTRARAVSASTATRHRK